MKIPIVNDIFTLFFPQVCEVCGSGLVYGETIICIRCLIDLPRTDYHDQPDNKTAQLFAGIVPFKKASSFFIYTKHSAYTNIIHGLKYEGKQEIGRYFGEIFGNELKHSGFCESIDCIIPVPLHKKRHRERGFNQSLSIAEGIAKATGIAIDKNSVKRMVYTKTQTKKTKAERFGNVDHIFSLSKNHRLSHKHVLLLDDVITTGATIESLAQALESVEGISISIVSLALANH
jgi:ComF family protein